MIVDCSINNIKYENNTVLENINFKLNKGECLMISGNSGSGKTTLLLFVSGLLQKKQASIDGTCNISNNAKLVYIAQNPDSNIISNDVKSELLLNSSGDVLKINSLLDRYNISDSFINKKTDELSDGQKQLLAVLSGILQNADLYVFDEPTAMLDNENTLMVSKTINQLLKNNKTVIISTHNPDRFDIAFKPLVLKSQTKKYQNNVFRSRIKGTKDYIFELKNLHFYYNKNEIIFKDFCLSLTNEDVLLISGKNGTGKTTLAKLMAGLLKPKKGTIKINERKIKKYKNYLPVLFSYSLQNPNWQLLFETIEKEVNFSINKYLKENANSHIKNLISLFTYTNIDKFKEPRELSFGQKKFITNFSFYHDPIIHFFDEPDLGTDEVFNNYFLDYIAYRKEKGLISIIVSHNSNKYKAIATKNIILN